MELGMDHRNSNDRGDEAGGQRAPVRRLLTEREVCGLLSVGRTTLRTLPLRPVHVNRCVRYVSTDVGDYIDALKRSGNGDTGSPVEQLPLPFGHRDDGRGGGDAA